ncbi:hypothetical protein QN277_007829 [Acacia crassicarpa]|uniref:HhH-GPD domain-containing protein n=1 Tax=Acacia crassicarpa TaxID=499986 RepID=A0AAE1MFS5_9FABA|nr:hypothetical protein QN277_007829 [Acacia crassicarpa]
MDDFQRRKKKQMPCEDAPHPFAQHEYNDRTKDNTGLRDAFPFHNSPSPATEGSTNVKSSPYSTTFLRKMKCGIRRDFEGVKSVTERENEGKIVVEFSDGNIIAISRFIESNRKILIDFEKHKKKKMECEHASIRRSRKRKSADAVKMVSWRQEGDSIIFQYDNGKTERQSVFSYKGPLTKTRIPSLTKFERKKEAYRKKTPDNMWKPPCSTHALLQEEYAHDPWKVVAICMLLNRTSGEQVKEAIPEFFKLCPDPETCVQVPVDQIIEEITRLGFQYTRACNLKLFSLQYMEDTWTYITELHGVGRYAADAYAIFFTGRWKDVIPMDHKLIPYWTSLHKAGY